MNDVIKYRPYRSSFWISLCLVAIAIFFFIWIGYGLSCFPKIDSIVIFLSAYGIIDLLGAKSMYDLSNITVFFECEGLRIAGGRYDAYHYALWKDIDYAYYSRGYHNNLFLVLSPKPLNQKQVKRLINGFSSLTEIFRSFFFFENKIFVDSAFVIYIGALKDVSQLRELISSKVLHIETEWRAF